METKSPSLEDCLKLLRGEKDEQKLAGLFLATKISDWSDTASVIKIYNALGARFLHRLLVTGMGKGDTGMEGRADWEAYLKLSVTVLAGFCRVPEIASSEEMVSIIPLISEIISNLSDSSIIEECYEFLVLVASASEKGIIQILESGSIEPLARHILHDGIEDSRSQELAIRLLQLIVDRIPSYNVDKRYLSGMSLMVSALSRQFALLHNTLKFEVMHVLISFLSSTSAIFNETLRELLGTNWAAYISIGIMEILRNRIVSCEKLQALRLLDLVMYVVGQNILLEDKTFDDVEATLPIDKFLLLVLESARVEIAVHLNELAYLKYEASKTSSNAGTIELKRQNLAVLYSLVEKIIKLISSAHVADGTIINEGILLQMISGLNETISLVLDFLQDAKDHCVWKGDDLLAAVRILGSYLAQTPSACQEKTRGLLQHILSIEGDDESSPFYSICFLLPMLCQTTMNVDGCKALASFGGHKSVVDFLVNLLRGNGTAVESGTIYIACDTILNILSHRKELEGQIEESPFLQLLQEFSLLAENNNDPSLLMIASSICALVFDLTSEEKLLNLADFNHDTLERLSKLIALSLSQMLSKDEIDAYQDLYEIVRAGYDRWSSRYPSVQNTVLRSMNP